MATTTTRLGLRKPAGSDTVSVTTDLDANYDKIDTAISMTVCTSSTRPSTPFQGQEIYETDTHNNLVYNGTTPASAGWQHQSIPVVSALAAVVAPYTNQVVVLSTDARQYYYTGSTWVVLPSAGVSVTVQSAPGNSGTVSGSITYTEARTGAASEAGIAFVAPPSGAVRIDWSCGISSSDTTKYALVSFVVRTGNTVGSGTTVQAASDNVVLQSWGSSSENSYAQFYYLSGLTAGGAYNLRLAYRIQSSTAQTGTFNRPKVLVEPVLA